MNTRIARNHVWRWILNTACGFQFSPSLGQLFIAKTSCLTTQPGIMWQVSLDSDRQSLRMSLELYSLVRVMHREGKYWKCPSTPRGAT